MTQDIQRSCIETGRQSGDEGRADPTATGGAGEAGGISQLQRSPLRSEESQPHAGLPSPEEPTHHLAVKTSRDSICPGRQKAAWIP